MGRRALIILLVTSAASATLLGVAASAWQTRSVAVVEGRIVSAAQAFLKTLDEKGRARAARPFDDAARFEWFFTPVARTGLPLKEMTLAQRAAALALLQSITSTQGVSQGHRSHAARRNSRRDRTAA